MKILIASLLYDNVEHSCYVSHSQFWYRVGKQMPNVEFVFSAGKRRPIDAARNEAVLLAQELNCDYIFFYDMDMILNPNVLISLLNRNKDVVGAFCYIRGYPYKPMIFRKTEAFKNYAEKPFEIRNKEDLMENYSPTKEEFEKGLIEVDALGTASTLIKTDIFKDIPYPWFVTGRVHTEDLYFFSYAKTLKPELEYWCDLTVESGHLGDPPVICSKNVEALRKFYEGGNYNNFYPVTVNE